MSFKKFSVLLVFLTFSVIATEDTTLSSSLSISPWGFFTLGNVVKSQFIPTVTADGNFNNFWISDFDAGLKVHLKIGKYGKTRFNFGLTTGFILCKDKSETETRQRTFKPYLLDGALEHNFVVNRHSLYAEFGFFPFKYNPQVRNLGEYLFRSNAYPSVIYTNFDITDEKLVGFHGKYTFTINDLNNVQADLLVTSEKLAYPLHDISLSYIFTGNIMNFVNMGLGLSHTNIISFDTVLTTPAYDTANFSKSFSSYNNVGFKDSLGNTTDYTFRSTKLMGRVTLDPKAFIETDIFGSEDLKLYAEGIMLGIKNYDGWYENLKNRIVYSFGFNIPTFKILDVLAVEGEFWDNPYWNAAHNIRKNGYTTPFIGNDRESPNYYSFFTDTSYQYKPVTGNKWKWSIYASKTIFNRLSIICQFASDHTMRDKFMAANSKRYTELFQKTKDWYWITKIKFYY